MFYVLLTYLAWPGLRLLARRRGGARVPERFLVVQTAKIGDLVYATPLWRAIRAAHPGAHVALLAHPAAAALAEHDGALDAVHTVDAAALRGLAGKWRLARLVRGGRYDVALCLTPALGLALGLLWGLVPRVALLVPDVAGATFRCLARLGARAAHRRGEPLSAAYGRMAAAAGIAGDMRARALAPAPGAEGRVREFLASRGVPPGTALVGIAPAAGNPVKQWLPDRVAALADRVSARAGARVVLIGSAADRPLVGAILGRMEAPAVDAAGAFALGDLPAMLSGLTLLVAADSGPLHIAEAMGVPAVIIGGPADLRERDLRTPHRLVQQHLPCLPCVSAFRAPYACPLGHHRCIVDTGVEEIWAAVRAMLDGVAPARRLAAEARP
ncbi:MAG TPA: glycosyltransferase family 9 protein [Candidatus Methylomirabilis sp.]|jgi:ADP-heptose:LPS heptosyltransferase